MLWRTVEARPFVAESSTVAFLGRPIFLPSFASRFPPRAIWDQLPSSRMGMSSQDKSQAEQLPEAPAAARISTPSLSHEVVPMVQLVLVHPLTAPLVSIAIELMATLLAVI